MAQQSLSAKKMAIMVSAGFDETQFINIQKSMMSQNGWLKVISNKPGLVNGTNNGMLGMAYPVDAVLSETLAIDYDGLIIPGGAAHIEKLKAEPHALRILRAFLREDMPVLFVEEAVDMLADVESEISASDFNDEDVSLVKNIVRASGSASMSSALSSLAHALGYSEEEQAA